jgi:hypothetical protein
MPPREREEFSNLHVYRDPIDYPLEPEVYEVGDEPYDEEGSDE